MTMRDYDEMYVSKWSPAGQAGHRDILGVYCGPEEPDYSEEFDEDPDYQEICSWLTPAEAADFKAEWVRAKEARNSTWALDVSSRYYDLSCERCAEAEAEAETAGAAD